MSYTDENGNKCVCSRNRQCGFHRAQTKKLQRVAKPLHDAQKVQVGIEDLRAKYAKPQPVKRPIPAAPRIKNGWNR